MEAATCERAPYRDAAWLVRILKVELLTSGSGKSLGRILARCRRYIRITVWRGAMHWLCLSRLISFLVLNEAMNRLLPSAKELNSFMTAWIGRDSISYCAD